MTDKSEEFMAACKRTPAQIYEEYANELRTDKELLEETEKGIAKQIDDYLYKTLEPYALPINKEYTTYLLVYDGDITWRIPVKLSREEYDERGGIRRNIDDTKDIKDLLTNWPRIKAAFHHGLNDVLENLAKRMKSEAAKVAEREKIIENFKI